MHWIRPAGSALVLLLLMTSAASADSSVQQLGYSVPPVKGPVAPQAGESRANPATTALSRLASLTGGHRISAGISSGSEVLGVENGHVVSQRWTNFHISVGLFPDTVRRR